MGSWRRLRGGRGRARVERLELVRGDLAARRVDRHVSARRAGRAPLAGRVALRVRACASCWSAQRFSMSLKSWSSRAAATIRRATLRARRARRRSRRGARAAWLRRAPPGPASSGRRRDRASRRLGLVTARARVNPRADGARDDDDRRKPRPERLRRPFGGARRSAAAALAEQRELLALGGAEDLARADELELHVAELDDVAGLDDAATQIGAVDAHAVARPLVDDLVAALAQACTSQCRRRDRVVVDRDRRVLGAPDRHPVTVEGELGPRRGPHQHDQPVRAVHQAGRARVGPLAK